MSRLKEAASHGVNGTRYAAIYVRVSTEDQGKGFSIPTQLEACQRLAAHEGYAVPESHVLIDEGISGTTMDRPGLRKLRDLVNTKAIAAVIVIDPDRLSRNLGHQLLLAEEFERAAVKLLIVSHPMEQGPEGWLFFQMRGALAEYERAKILERTKRGMLGRAKAGHVHGGNVPLGYRYVAGPHEGRVEIEEQEAVVVREIFALGLRGISSWSIVRRLTEARVPTKRDRHPTSGGRKWSGLGVWNHDSVYRVLTNEAYIGKLCWNKRRRLTPSTTVARGREEWVEIPVPPIVPADVFAAVRARLEKNKALARRNRKREYLFVGGWLRCGRCGRAMTGFAPKGHPRYRCSSVINIADRAGQCRGSLNATVAEASVWALIEDVLQRPEVILAEVTRQHEGAEARRAECQREISILNDALAKCDREDLRWKQAYSAELIGLDELKGYRAEIEARRQSLLALRQGLHAALAGIDQAAGHVELLVGYCERVKQTLQTFDHAEKRLAFEALNVRVIWRPGEPLVVEGTIPLGEIATITSRCDQNAASGARHRPHIGRRRAASPPP